MRSKWLTWSPNGSPLKKTSAFPNFSKISQNHKYGLDEHIRKPEILNDVLKARRKIYKFSSEAAQGVLFSTYLFLEEEKAKLRLPFLLQKKVFYRECPPPGGWGKLFFEEEKASAALLFRFQVLKTEFWEVKKNKEKQRKNTENKERQRKTKKSKERQRKAKKNKEKQRKKMKNKENQYEKHNLGRMTFKWPWMTFKWPLVTLNDLDDIFRV